MPQILLSEGPDQGVRLLTLNRPEALNALNTALLDVLSKELDAAEADPDTRAVVITGSERAFAAGADINEMAARDLVGMLEDPRTQHWARIARFTKPLITAVNGFCLGGGCELAMNGDIIIAGNNARFGQPEINLGIMPGAGGTQRLVRAVGQSLAMQMVLTGEPIGAERALDAGLVSEVCQPELTVERALAIARTIASKGPIAVQLAREAVQRAEDMDLAAGLRFERHAFTILAATDDRREGLDAFQNKRKPEFTGR
ncbi:2,3-dehydroadipyl-CoA hydratase [Marinobacter adhaerens]|uniref:2,3-dehydroadipyl-CoA hydratase n=1 Tax=Marinobacter adhaerens TaxID=1033846 RepID=A0A851HQ59_9GAMM|nr:MULTISPECIES: 2,3-dehydroadipyl-CoA hydratase PaaF [Marinobacter]NWN91879.1 2,3-dehydroadipyl-CoA hydratase [Marinobacter adhaerens]